MAEDVNPKTNKTVLRSLRCEGSFRKHTNKHPKANPLLAKGNSMNKTLLTFCACITLSACAGSPIIMQNPKTQEVAQCNTAAVMGTERYVGNERCAKAYEKAGWTRLTSDDNSP